MKYLRIALNNSQYPFKYEERQVPALIPGLDTVNRAPSAFTGAAENMDWNIPQVIHMENYLPTARGYVSTAWNIRINSQDAYQDLINTQTEFSSGLGAWDQAGISLESDYLHTAQDSGRYLFKSEGSAATLYPSKSGELFYLASGTVISYCFLYTSTGVVTPKLTYSTSTNPFIPPTIGPTLPGSYDTNTQSFTGTFTVVTSGYYQPCFAVASGANLRLSSIYITYGTSLAETVNSVNLTSAGLTLYKAGKLYPQVGESSWSPTAIVTLPQVDCKVHTATVNSVVYNLYHSPSTGYSSLRVGAVAQTLSLPAATPSIVFSTLTSYGTYLVGSNGTSIYWSTPTNALDFVSYGSGYSTPSGLMGSIVALVPIVSGFIIFSNRNAVLATYTNIPTAPFRFSVITNSGGIQSIDEVSGDRQAEAVYAVTTVGFQVFTKTGNCATVPEVTDFLQSGKFQQFATDGTVQYVRRFPYNLTGYRTSVSLINSRYVAISYRSANTRWYEHAIVLDTVLNRWGHVRVAHMAALETPTFAGTLGVTSGLIGDICFLTPVGSLVRAVDPGESDYAVITSGIYQNHARLGVRTGLILGPISLTRDSKFTLQEIEISSVKYSADFEIKARASAQGLLETTNVLSPAVAFNSYSSTVIGASRTHYGRLTGDNLELTILGNANLQNIVLGVTNHGN